MSDHDAIPASIHAHAKLWTVLSGEYEQETEFWGVFWEPLAVRIGPDARPQTCYSEHVAFYDRSGPMAHYRLKGYCCLGCG